MAVALNDNALLNPADAHVQAFLKLPGATGSANNDALITLINRASDYCESYCNRPLKAQDFANIRLRAQCDPNLSPPAWPIDPGASVALSVDGIALTVWRSEADGDPAQKDVILLGETPGRPRYFRRECGWLGRTTFPIVASFTGGLDPIPGDLVQAALLVCQTMQRQEKGQSEVQSYGPGPVSQSVSYRADSLIPMWSKQVLDHWRVLPL